MLFVHMDDRSDKDVPSTPVQTETVQYANPCHIHGQHDHADNTADIYIMEPGGGSKTTSCVKDEWCASYSSSPVNSDSTLHLQQIMGQLLLP